MGRHGLSLRAALRLETIEERVTPSAVVDLTTRGTEGVADTAILRQTDAQPTGTGHIQSFVRVQGTGTEQGYNTDARPLQFDENKSPSFTRSLKLSAVTTTVVNGTAYREFLLDINQKSSAPLLSLDELKVYVGSTPDKSGYDAASGNLAGMSPVYNLDGAGDVTVRMDYRLNSGSGSGDVAVLIPESRFSDSDQSGFVYLYSKFSGANAGFEEWAVRGTGGKNGTDGNASLGGFVYLDANSNGVRDQGELGIGGVTIQLQGVDDQGRNVVLTTTTGEDGSYYFTNLRAGTYTIMEVDPEGYEDGADTIGTQGGSVDNDRFFDIFLASGFNGRENNFGEWEAYGQL